MAFAVLASGMCVVLAAISKIAAMEYPVSTPTLTDRIPTAAQYAVTKSLLDQHDRRQTYATSSTTGTSVIDVFALTSTTYTPAPSIVSSTTPAQTAVSNSQGDGLNAGSIAIIIIGSVLFTLAVISIIVGPRIRQRRKRRQAATEVSSTSLYQKPELDGKISPALHGKSKKLQRHTLFEMPIYDQDAGWYPQRKPVPPGELEGRGVVELDSDAISEHARILPKGDNGQGV